MASYDPAATAAGAQGAVASAAVPVLGSLLGAWRFYRGVRNVREDGPHAQALSMKYSFVTMFMIFVCALYGLVGALVINTRLSKDPSFVPGNAAYAAGLINGVTSFCSAVGLGYFGEVAVRCGVLQPRLFVGYVLINIYIEAFALYGLILALVTLVRAGDAHVDIPAPAVVPFASVDILANLGGVLGSVLPAISIVEVGIERPDLVARCMIPVVMSGVTGIYGLIACIVDVRAWPPAGGNMFAGVLFLISSMIIASVGSRGVRGVGEDPSTFVGMVLKLIQGQSLGLAGLVYSLVMTGSREHPSSTGMAEDGASPMPETFLADSLAGGSPVLALAFLFLPLLIAFLLGVRRRPSALGDALLA